MSARTRSRSTAGRPIFSAGAMSVMRGSVPMARLQSRPDRRRCSPRLRRACGSRPRPPTGLAHMRRVMPDGEAFLVVNSSAQPVDSPARFETRRRRLYELDPANAVAVRPSTPSDSDGFPDRSDFASTLAARPSSWRPTTSSPPLAGAPAVRLGEQSVALEPTQISRSEPNVLVVDSCELEMGDKTFPREAVYAANERLWRAHGFETNGWFGVIQYRDQILAANRRMTADTGGAVTYRFELADGLPTDGDPVGGGIAGTLACLGQRPRRRSHRGRTLAGRPHPGDYRSATAFARARTRSGWRADRSTCGGRSTRSTCWATSPAGPPIPAFVLEPARPSHSVPWRAQGCPFYERAVAYQFELPARQEGVLALDEDDWGGSFLVVEQNGGIVARLWEPPYRVELDPAAGRAGHPPRGRSAEEPARAVPRAWGPAAPRLDADVVRPRSCRRTLEPGERYDLLDLGLFRPPRWLAAL